MRISNKDPGYIQKRLFRCPVCGSITPATKRKCETLPGHIKTMYCYQCRKRTEHEQIE